MTGEVAGSSVLQVSADSSGFDATMSRMEREAHQTEQTVVGAAGRMGAALSKPGEGAAKGATAAERDGTPSLVSMFATCRCTVCSLIVRRSAIA